MAAKGVDDNPVAMAVAKHEDNIGQGRGTLWDHYNVERLPDDQDLRKKLRRKIMKNIVVLSLLFLLHFTAYTGLSNLQSSLHIDQGMGTVTQSVIYGSMVLSCLFLPKIMIMALGHKWTIPISLIGYMLWMAANGYAVWGTMVPASILVGLSAAPLWTAQCAYFTKIAPKYAALNGETEKTAVTKFFGIFFGLFQISSVISSVISSTVLRPSDLPPENETLSAEEVQMFCGANDCPWNNVTNPNLEEPAEKTLWTLVGIYIGIACVGLVTVCVFVDELPVYLRDDKSKIRQEAKQSLVNTALHLRHRLQWLLIPITVYSGLEQGFYGAEYTKSFISCSLGIWMVGLVLIPAAASNSLMSFFGGYIVKYFHRSFLFTIGMLLNATLLLVFLLWPLDKDQEVFFYLSACGWAMADAIWQTQLNALYGVLFAKESEAAFCNYRMWESAGFIIAFAYSSFLCTDTKIYVTLAVLVLGMALYYVVECLLRNSDNRERKDSDYKPELSGSDNSEFDNSEFEMKTSVLDESTTYANVKTEKL